MNKYRKTPEMRLALSETQKKRVADGLDKFYRGITELRMLVRKSVQYKLWREKVYQRDNYTCKFCLKIGGKLNADHIKSFAIILLENNVKTLDDAIRCAPLWDTDNGRTLCFRCHTTTDTYGGRMHKIINKIQLC